MKSITRAGPRLAAAAVIAVAPLLPGAAPASAGPAVTAIPVPGDPAAVAVDPVTDTAYVASLTGGTVTVINLASDTVAATIPVGVRPSALAVDPATDVIYLSNAATHAVSVIDGATNSVTHTIPGVGGPLAVDPATDMIYAGTTAGVAVINGASDKVASTIAMPESSASSIAVDPVTDTVYAGGQGLIDAIYVINGAASTVSAVLESNFAAGIIVDPVGVAVDPVTNTFYTADYGRTVSAYNGATNAFLRALDVGGWPFGIADNADTHTVYAVVNSVTGNVSAANVSLIDGPADAITGTIPLPAGGVSQVAADPATGTLVATSPGHDTVYVIRLNPPAITSGNRATFTVGANGRFTLQADGTPAQVFSVARPLPPGLALSRQGVLTGVPGPGTGGIHQLTITASNGVSPAATQTFTLTVDQAPAITSANRAVFKAGVRGSFSVRTSGFPTPALAEKGHMPRGLRFVAHSNGTARSRVLPRGQRRS
jgi:large repetitive protein